MTKDFKLEDEIISIQNEIEQLRLEISIKHDLILSLMHRLRELKARNSHSK